MSQARIPMRKIRTIIRLHEQAGLTQRTISSAVGVSRPVVAYYLGLYEQSGLHGNEVEVLSDSELEQRLRPRESRTDPRYEELTALLPGILLELSRPGVTRQLLWEEYRTNRLDGYSYTQFCFHLQAFSETSELHMHLEHTAGEKLFVDFAGRKPQLIDPKTGIRREVELFVAIFPASALVYCEATESQKSIHFITATRHALEYAGGAPRIIVPDNLKSAVKTPDRYEPEINDIFDDFASHYGIAVVPARVRHPRDKALVESAVSLVYRRILAPLRDSCFQNLDDLNEALTGKLEELNDRPLQRLAISRRERFLRIEAPLLKPLPLIAYRFRRFRQATVQFNYHVYLGEDKHFYSVPYSYRRKEVRLVYDENSVEISYNHERIASHRRDRTPNGYSTQPEHMPPHHRFIAEWSPERFLSWAAKFGPQTERLIAEVLKKPTVVEQSFRTCMGILKLADRYEAPRLEAACRRALAYGIYQYRGIRTILEKGLDRTAMIQRQLFILPNHENIRGEEYYAEASSGGQG
jgi:transposase